MLYDKRCGCNHEHPHQTDAHAVPVEVTEDQKDFLYQLGHNHYLPVTRFTIKDSREGDFVPIALVPVFLRSAIDDMKTIKEAEASLQRLGDLGPITLGYDIPLNGRGYEGYKKNALYEYFCTTVAEGASRLNFLGNTPALKPGSIMLTEVREQIVTVRCNQNHHHHGQED